MSAMNEPTSSQQQKTHQRFTSKSIFRIQNADTKYPFSMECAHRPIVASRHWQFTFGLFFASPRLAWLASPARQLNNNNNNYVDIFDNVAFLFSIESALCGRMQPWYSNRDAISCVHAHCTGTLSRAHSHTHSHIYRNRIVWISKLNSFRWNVAEQPIFEYLMRQQRTICVWASMRRVGVLTIQHPLHTITHIHIGNDVKCQHTHAHTRPFAPSTKTIEPNPPDQNRMHNNNGRMNST